MSDYISRALALDLCPNNAVETLKKIPAADVAPVVRGKWIRLSTYSQGRWAVKCNCCGYSTLAEFNYCPNCGADMRGEQDV